MKVKVVADGSLERCGDPDLTIQQFDPLVPYTVTCESWQQEAATKIALRIRRGTLKIREIKVYGHPHKGQFGIQ